VVQKATWISIHGYFLSINVGVIIKSTIQGSNHEYFFMYQQNIRWW